MMNNPSGTYSASMYDQEIALYKALAVSVITTARTDLRSGNRLVRDRALRFFTAPPEDTTLWLWLSWLDIDYTGPYLQQLRNKAIAIYDDNKPH
jgi:hypothetical protein